MSLLARRGCWSCRAESNVKAEGKGSGGKDRLGGGADSSCSAWACSTNYARRQDCHRCGSQRAAMNSRGPSRSPSRSVIKERGGAATPSTPYAVAAGSATNKAAGGAVGKGGASAMTLAQWIAAEHVKVDRLASLAALLSALMLGASSGLAAVRQPHVVDPSSEDPSSEVQKEALRAKVLEFGLAIIAMAGFADPDIVAVRQKKFADRLVLQEQLRNLKPLKAQLQGATAQRDKALGSPMAIRSDIAALVVLTHQGAFVRACGGGNKGPCRGGHQAHQPAAKGVRSDPRCRRCCPDGSAACYWHCHAYQPRPSGRLVCRHLAAQGSDCFCIVDADSDVFAGQGRGCWQRRRGRAHAGELQVAGRPLLWFGTGWGCGVGPSSGGYLCAVFPAGGTVTPEQVALLEAVSDCSAHVTAKQLMRFAEEFAALVAGRNGLGRDWA